MAQYKIINDTIHGGIKVTGVFLDLCQAPELQRLAGIRQLGLSYLVFPGANHTRLEHSLGTSRVAQKMSHGLGLPKSEADLVCASALLHDIGHGPFSHTLEGVLRTKCGLDHMELTKDRILGKHEFVKDGRKIGGPNIPQILEKHGLDPKAVAALVTGGETTDGVTLDSYGVQNKQAFFNDKHYLGQMIHSALDADQIDYLLRDSHYTGVAHGTIDLDRLMLTLELFNNDLAVNKRGISAVEGMLVARSLMYASVYFHKTVRIAELMLSQAVDRLEEDPTHIQGMVDGELMEYLKGAGKYQRDMFNRLKYRRLFKKAFSLSYADLDDETKAHLASVSDPKTTKLKEEEICQKAGVEPGYVILDFPQRELLINEPRIKLTDVKMVEDGAVKPLQRLSPLAKALQAKVIPDWAVMVSADPKDLPVVAKAAKAILLEQ